MRPLEVLNSALEENAEARCRTVKRAIDAFVGDAEQFDDITMLSLRFNFFRDDESILTLADTASTEFVWDFINRRTKEAGMNARITNRAQVIVDEIYSNIHQYSGATKVQIFCSVNSDKIVLTFKDDGIPFNPLTSLKPDTTLSAEDRNFGGLGILMVKEMSSDLSYVHENGYNVLTVTVQLETEK
jgi:sigma-B regulation protein RsbU (phosphoserine phosphatase)